MDVKYLHVLLLLLRYFSLDWYRHPQIYHSVAKNHFTEAKGAPNNALHSPGDVGTELKVRFCQHNETGEFHETVELFKTALFCIRLNKARAI